MVLEDRPADAALAIRQLERADYAVDWQRVETLRDFRARLTPNLDLILADYSLPGFTVVDALPELRAATLDIPLVVVSRTVGEDRAVECLKMGTTEYILKDRMARLGPAVRRALPEGANQLESRRAQDAFAASEQQMCTILST